MAQKQVTDKLSIYIPQTKIGQKPVERLIRLGEKTDRSVNYLVVEAILDYLRHEERKGQGASPRWGDRESRGSSRGNFHGRC